MRKLLSIFKHTMRDAVWKFALFIQNMYVCCFHYAFKHFNMMAFIYLPTLLGCIYSALLCTEFIQLTFLRGLFKCNILRKYLEMAITEREELRLQSYKKFKVIFKLCFY